MSRRLGIGIDTGGTFTDACLFDFSTQEVLRSSKARTTYHNLAVGINSAVAALGNDLFSQVEMVSLSTTLATNAMVEGRGGRECLLLLGYERELMERLSADVGLTLHDHVFFVPGKIDIYGRETEPVDLAAAREAILKVQHTVDAVGISGFLSVLNPAHELAVKQLVEELTALPVTCGHELTGQLQSVKRAATVALNARLIPIVRQLIDSVQHALQQQGISAPLVVVQGDGSLVRAEVAIQQPVQTILSGPAASCTGGAYLAKYENCIVVDTGGTTTDIAVLQNGAPELDPNGASVGNWRTSIGAVRVRTIGIGGDSHIKVTNQQTIEIGPQRVIPLCVAANDYANVRHEISRLATAHQGLALVQTFDFLCVLRAGAAKVLNEQEERVVQELTAGPLSLYQLAAKLGISHPLLLDTGRLEQLGVLGRIGLTPTDLLHTLGHFTRYDTASASTAVTAVATSLDMTPDDFINHVHEVISKRLALEILSQVLATGEQEPINIPGCEACDQLVHLGLGLISSETKGGLHCRFSLDYPIIALGAPGGTYLEQTTRLLGGQLVVPQHNGVANAVGAITGNVICTASCVVVPEYNTTGIVGYQLTGIASGGSYAEPDLALEAAKQQAGNLALLKAAQAGASDISLRIDTVRTGEKVLLETRVTATAIGRPTLKSALAASQ